MSDATLRRELQTARVTGQLTKHLTVDDIAAWVLEGGEYNRAATTWLLMSSSVNEIGGQITTIQLGLMRRKRHK